MLPFALCQIERGERCVIVWILWSPKEPKFSQFVGIEILSKALREKRHQKGLREGHSVPTPNWALKLTPFFIYQMTVIAGTIFCQPAL